MRLLARVGAIGLVVVAVYWVLFNAWWVFGWEPTMASFDDEPSASRAGQLVELALYAIAPALVVFGSSAWIWRKTQRQAAPEATAG